MVVDPNSHLSDPVVRFVRGLLLSVIVEADAKQEYVYGQSYHIALPPPPGADYCFTLWLYGDEKQISAKLLNSDAASYFWYRPFEEAEFRSAERLNKAVIDTVELIMRHNTRIEQRRGLVSTHFKCEYESANGWRRIYSHSGLGWMRAPKIAGRRHVYQSPPLIREL